MVCLSWGKLAIGGRVVEVLVEDEVDITDFFDKDGAKFFIGVKNKEVSACLDVVENSFLVWSDIFCL